MTKDYALWLLKNRWEDGLFYAFCALVLFPMALVGVGLAWFAVYMVWSMIL